MEKVNNFLESEKREDDIESEDEKSFIKKIFKGAGIGGLVVGSGFLGISFYILQFLFVASAGLSMIREAILLFSKGSIISIILGLVVLFIGTPIAIGLASYLFIFFLFLSILALIIWGITYISGFDISFVSVRGGIGLIIIVLILGSLAFSGIRSFIETVKNKNVLSFFKENWFYISIFFSIFFFSFWLFFFS